MRKLDDSKNIERLKNWVAKHGNDESSLLPVPGRAENEDELRLAYWRNWVIRMIWRGYDAGRFNETVSLIKEIHPHFLDNAKNTMNVKATKQVVDRIEAFIREHGRPPAQGSSEIDDENYLGVRSSVLRQRHHEGKLDDASIRYIKSKNLGDLLLSRKRKRLTNDENFRLLKEFVTRNGYKPRANSPDDEERRLGNWLIAQLFRYRNEVASNEMTQSRRQRVADFVEHVPSKRDKEKRDG